MKKRGLGSNRGLDALLANIKVGRQVEQTVSTAIGTPVIADEMHNPPASAVLMNDVDDNVADDVQLDDADNQQASDEQIINDQPNVEPITEPSTKFGESSDDTLASPPHEPDSTMTEQSKPSEQLQAVQATAQSDEQPASKPKIVLTVREIEQIKLFWQQGLQI